MDDNERRAYERTASAIGFEPAELLRARVLAFFAEHGIPLFPYQQVTGYLNQLVADQGPVYRWWWRPLRPADTTSAWQWGGEDEHVEAAGVWVHPNDSYNFGRWECRPYHRAVPLRVLERVERIEGAFAGRVKFFVTEYGRALTRHPEAVGRPDPFICVTALDLGRLVFDVWDEPGFTG